MLQKLVIGFVLPSFGIGNLIIVAPEIESKRNPLHLSAALFLIPPFVVEEMTFPGNLIT